MTNDLSRVVFYDAPPIHVMSAWLSLLLPLILGVASVVLRRRAADHGPVVANKFYAMLFAQCAFFTFCTTASYLDDRLRLSVTMGKNSAAYFAFTEYGLRQLAWGIAIQAVMTSIVAFLVMFNLKARPKMRDLRLLVTGICLLALAEVIAAVVVGS